MPVRKPIYFLLMYEECRCRTQDREILMRQKFELTVKMVVVRNPLWVRILSDAGDWDTPLSPNRGRSIADPSAIHW